MLDIAGALDANVDLIISENEADLAAAQDSGYEKSLVARMTLKAGKVGLNFTAVSVHLFDYVWS